MIYLCRRFCHSNYYLCTAHHYRGRQVVLVLVALLTPVLAASTLVLATSSTQDRLSITLGSTQVPTLYASKFLKKIIEIFLIFLD